MSLEVEQFGAIINGVAADAAADSRTAEINVKSASSITFSISITQNNATALAAVLYKSVDGGTTYTRVHSASISSGTGTMSEYTISEDITGDDDMTAELDVAACTDVKIVVSATGGGSSDLITVKASAAIWS